MLKLLADRAFLLTVLLLAAVVLACGAPEVEPVGPGVVEPKPQGAAQVDVVLGEWVVSPQPNSVIAGQVYFLANNVGPEDPHELVIIKSDLAPDALPVVEGKVVEEQADIIGEIEEFAPNSKASGVFDLSPGNYILICNLVEIEHGELESHYLEGMTASFTVQ